MREIKFKCWIPSEKFMGVPFNPFENDFEDPYKTGGRWRDDSIFLQFTGLRDKNGKEIYEGDVLENDRHQRGVIKFIDASFVLYAKRKNGDIFLLPLTTGSLNNKNIIGNIHQNPELLQS